MRAPWVEALYLRDPVLRWWHHVLFSHVPYSTHERGSFDSDQASQCGWVETLKERLVPRGILQLPGYPSYPQPRDGISTLSMFYISTFGGSKITFSSPTVMNIMSPGNSCGCFLIITLKCMFHTIFWKIKSGGQKVRVTDIRNPIYLLNFPPKFGNITFEWST